MPFSSNTVNSSAASITPLNTNISFSVCTVTPTAVFTTPVSFSSETQSKDTVAFLMPLAASDESEVHPSNAVADIFRASLKTVTVFKDVQREKASSETSSVFGGKVTFSKEVFTEKAKAPISLRDGEKLISESAAQL